MESEPQVVELRNQEKQLDEASPSVQGSFQYVITLLTNFQYVIAVFTNIIKIIKEDFEIHSYLREIQMEANQLIDSYSEIVKSLKEVHTKSKGHVIMGHIIGRAWAFLKEFLRSKDISKLDSKQKTVWFLELETRIFCSLEYFLSFKEQEDITVGSKERYRDVWEKIKIDEVRDIAQLKESNEQLQGLLHITASAVINEERHQLCLIRVVTFGLSFLKYFIMTDSAKLHSFKFYRSPTISLAQKIWNLLENGATRELSKLTYQGVKTNIKIYVPLDGVFNRTTDILTENPNSITVRILYNKKIRMFGDRKSIPCCASGSQQGQFVETVLVHMHGGGFIALSSRSMQCYTRRWANQLDVPIFSIDYRMPPNHPFPHAPQDCLLVYRFLVHHVHKYMNVRATNIYLAGDSAGGNLACALTALILKHKQPIPRALYLAYPVTDFRIIYSDSKLFAMTDILLWPSMLLLCQKEYLQGDLRKRYDPLVSVVLVNEQYVGGASGDKRFPLNWPKTMMTVGAKDPLRDDTLSLMQRMVKSNVECQCVLYQQLSHGYLNTGNLIQQCKKTVKNSIDHLKELMKTSAFEEGSKQVILKMRTD